MGFIFGFMGQFNKIWETEKNFQKIFEDLNFRGEVHDTFTKRDHITMVAGEKILRKRYNFSF
jgi:hypothetical protein